MKAAVLDQVKAPARARSFSVREVAAIGAGSMALKGRVARALPVPKGPVSRRLKVRPQKDGSALVVDADTGALVAPCASVELAESLKGFFS